jgi:hypothetical protein
MKMLFGPLPEGANLYVINALLILAYSIFVIIGFNSKRNYFAGVRTPETLGNDNIWKEVNRRVSIVTLSFTAPLFTLNLVFAILKFGEPFGIAILVVFALGMIIINTYSLKYAQNLARRSSVEVQKTKIPLTKVILLLLGTIFLALIWLLIWNWKVK